MEMLNREKILKRQMQLFSEIEKGKIFIYPTDTIYGLGCDATNFVAVAKIRKIKMREEKPFSIIVPDKRWIEKNCVVDFKARKWINKLPGKFTLILQLKNKICICDKVILGGRTIGVRIPDNWFCDFLRMSGKPFVTTSVNFSGEKFVARISDIPKKILENVDYVVDDGVLDNSASTIVNLSFGKEEIIKR